MKKKIIVSAIAIVLVLCCAIGGTLAWLTDATDPITNTFTVGNVRIGLTETAGTLNGGNREFKMVPGTPIEKDPTVTVKAGSEACYLFVKVEESEDLLSYITYKVNGEWRQLTDAEERPIQGVYYRMVDAETAAAGEEYSIIGYTNAEETFVADQVLVNSTVTNEMMDEITEGTEPTLTFTAYAIQQSGFDTPLKAWEEVSSPAQG